MNNPSASALPITAYQLQSALFEQHPLPGLIVDPQSLRIVLANKAALAFYGYAAGELYTQDLTRLFHPLDEVSWLHDLKRSGAQEWKGYSLQVKKGGEEAMMELFVSGLEVEGQRLWQVAAIDITVENARQQQALAETEKYKVYIEQSSEGIFCQQFRSPLPLDLPWEEFLEHLKTDCYVSECNSALARMYGYEHPAELIGALPDQLLDLSDQANIDYIRSFIDNGCRLFDAESHEKDRFGNDKYFLNNAVGIVEDGCLVCIWGTQRDITERKRAEKDMRLLANLVEQTSDVLTSTDLELKPTSWNRAAEKIYGIRADVAIGNHLHELLELSYPNTSADAVRNEIKTEGKWRGEVCFTRPTDQKRMTILASFKLLKDANDKPLGYLVAATDITERKETERKLKESENRFRYIADTAPVMIWICDEFNKTTYTSKQWMNFTGVDIVNDAPTGWSDVVHKEDVAEASEAFDECFHNKQPILLTYRIRTKDGTYRWVQDTGVPRFLEDGTFVGYIGCIVDIHDTKSKEEQLRQQTLILEQVTR